ITPCLRAPGGGPLRMGRSAHFASERFISGTRRVSLAPLGRSSPALSGTEVGVSSRRTMILIAAVVIGAIAAYALYTYIGGIEDEANDNAERGRIYKIVQDIPKGTFGDEAFAQGLIEEDVIAKENRPATAITDPAQIDGLVAISDLAANQVVVSNQFVPQATSLSTFSSLLKNNEVAITISIDQ